jgi:hypothetical protein
MYQRDPQKVFLYVKTPFELSAIKIFSLVWAVVLLSS